MCCEWKLEWCNISLELHYTARSCCNANPEPVIAHLLLPRLALQTAVDLHVLVAMLVDWRGHSDKSMLAVMVVLVVMFRSVRRHAVKQVQATKINIQAVASSRFCVTASSSLAWSLAGDESV